MLPVVAPTIRGEAHCDRLYVVPGTLHGVPLPGAEDGKYHRKAIGSCKVFEVLRGGGVKAGEDVSFAWAEPAWGDVQISGNTWNPKLERPTEFFRTDGAEVLARVDARKTGSDLMSNFVALPAGTSYFIATALQKIADGATIFDSSLAAQNHDKLKGLLEDENPFLACAAAQVLAKSGQCATLTGAVDSVHDFRGAVFIALAVLNSKDEEVTVTTHALAASANAARTVEQLEQIALGAWAVWGGGDSTPASAKAESDTILLDVRERTKALPLTREVKEYLSPLSRVTLSE